MQGNNLPWQAVLSEPALLAELVIFGYGKHLGPHFTLADGSSVCMGASIRASVYERLHEVR
jgi:hypothetical protein